jgi:hypothetical protein
MALSVPKPGHKNSTVLYECERHVHHSIQYFSNNLEHLVMKPKGSQVNLFLTNRYRIILILHAFPLTIPLKNAAGHAACTCSMGDMRHR